MYWGHISYILNNKQKRFYYEKKLQIKQSLTAVSFDVFG